MKPRSPAAPAALRWAVYFLSLILTFLWVWLLSFVLSDIGDLEGPEYDAIREQHVDGSLVERSTELHDEIRAIDVQIRRQNEIQNGLKNSMDNARATMEQMMSLHRLSLERSVNPTEAQQEALSTSQQRFIDAQEKYEEANNEIAESNQRKFELNQELENVNQSIEDQEEPAREEYQERRKQHRFKTASFKLLFIVPVFLVSSFLVFKKRESLFRPVFFSVLVASFWKVGAVMFEHFPREFFKYIAIAAAIIIVMAFLVWILKRVAKPGVDLLVKRYREAYQRHRCPVCDYPIMRGPLKNALWTRKGPKLPGTVQQADTAVTDEPYACPSCGSSLFESCTSCNKQRHSLLPFCDHCGTRKDFESLEDGINRRSPDNATA